MLPNQNDYSIIKVAQFLSGLTGRENFWDEVGKILLNTVNADLVAFGEIGAGGKARLLYHIIAENSSNPHHRYSAEDIRNSFFKDEQPCAQIMETIATALESSFIDTKILIGPPPLSVTSLPLSRGSRLSTALLVGYVTEKTFDKEQLDILLALAGLVETTAGRLATEEELKLHRLHLEEMVVERTNELNSQLDFEKMISNLSSYFIGLPADRLDEGINYALRSTGEFFRADRSYLFQFSEDSTTMSNTHEWVAEGISPQLENSQNRLLENLPWWANQVRTREHISIPDVEALPVEANAEKKLFKHYSIQSLFCVPIIRDNNIFGFLGFDFVREKRNWSEGQVTLLKVIAEVIADTLIRHQKDRTIRYLSMHDQLTGLYNRHYFVNELERLQNSREYPIAIISADLDGLKLINDSLGHIEGDLYLQAGAKALKAKLRSYDQLARVGGDEFALILPQTDQRAGELLIKRIRHQIEQYNKQPGILPLSISIGLAVTHGNAISLEETYKQADGFIYQDKLIRGKKAKKAIIDAMLASLANRSDYVVVDLDQLEQLCTALGKKAGLNEKELSGLHLLARFYDIGLVALPEGSLNKEAQRGEPENSAMRLHVERGYDITQSVPWLAETAELILHHHEHWDGSGYPLGLQGEAIPLECRILAVVETYIRLAAGHHPGPDHINHRAIEELKKLSGTVLDPVQVKQLINLLENQATK